MNALLDVPANPFGVRQIVEEAEGSQDEADLHGTLGMGTVSAPDACRGSGQARR
jgi:hypothetical protein